MAHPFEAQAKASNARRLSKLGAKAGKPFGASSMFHAKSYPKKNAGSSTPMTIAGGSSKKRADRAAHYADGGFVPGGKRGKRKGHSTTNIIIAGGGPGGGAQGPQAVPVPVPRPVPVPVRPGIPPVGPGAGAPPPPMGGPMAGGGGPPVNVNVPPPAPMPGMRPGMANGGVAERYHDWGAGMKDGGGVQKKQFGGGVAAPGAVGPVPGRRPVRPTRPPPRAAAAPAPAAPAPMPAGRPRMAQGIMPRPGLGMKDGGHADEEQDKALFKKMMKSKKYQDGGTTTTDDYDEGGVKSGDTAQAETSNPLDKLKQNAGKGLTGLGDVFKRPPQQGAAQGAGQAASAAGSLGAGLASAAGGMARGAGLQPGQIKLSGSPIGRQQSPFAKNGGAIKKADGGFVAKNQDSKDRSLAGYKYRNQGAGYNKGGSVRAGGASGLGRLAKSRSAAAVPAKTEI